MFLIGKKKIYQFNVLIPELHIKKDIAFVY